MTVHHLPHSPTNGSTPTGSVPWEGDLGDNTFQSFARVNGAEFKRIAITRLLDTAAAIGASVSIDPVRYAGIYPIDGVLTTGSSARLIVLAHGCIDDGPNAGLRRVDTTQKLLATCYGLHAEQSLPCLIITSHLPEPRSQSARLLAAAARHLGSHLVDVIATTTDFAGALRLQRLLTSTSFDVEGDAPWRTFTRPQQNELFPTVNLGPVS